MNRTQKLMVWLLVVTVLWSVVGCSDAVYVAPAVPAGVQLYDVGGRNYAREFRLKDGTRCVTMTDAGVDCDWKRGPE